MKAISLRKLTGGINPGISRKVTAPFLRQKFDRLLPRRSCEGPRIRGPVSYSRLEDEDPFLFVGSGVPIKMLEKDASGREASESFFRESRSVSVRSEGTVSCAALAFEADLHCVRVVWPCENFVEKHKATGSEADNEALGL